MKTIAKQKDDGTYALMGMMYECASYFNVSIHSECVLHIVNIYLKHINYCTFFEWIRGFNPSKKVIVMDRELLEENFNDLLSYSEDLEVLQGLFMDLYDQRVLVDKYAGVLFSTTFNLSFKKRIKLNYIGIVKEFERLHTLKDRKIIKWEDIDRFVECVYHYGYDINKDCKYSTNDIDETADNIIKRIQQVFQL